VERVSTVLAKIITPSKLSTDELEKGEMKSTDHKEASADHNRSRRQNSSAGYTRILGFLMRRK
jgi:hypothetical protein